MNKVSVIWLSVISIAIIILFYLQQNNGGKKNLQSGKSPILAKASNDSTIMRLAYIDLDTIKERYEYFKLKSNELEREKQRIENEIESGVQKLEADRNIFMKKGQSITQQEAEQFQMEFQTRYQSLGEKREKMLNQHLANQTKALDDIQAKINAYLDVYNASAGYHFIFSTGEGNLTLYHKDKSFNITDEVIAGLNEDYQKEKKK